MLISLMLGIAVIMLPVLIRVIFKTYTDYATHNDAVVQMARDRQLMLPHFLYHIVVYVVQRPMVWIKGSESYLRVASLITALCFYELLGLVLYARLKQAAAGLKEARWWLVPVLVICLMLTAPVFLLAAFDHKHYFGYIATNAYHNPTLPALKPFAVLLFPFAMAVFEQRMDTGRSIVFAALLTVLALLAKPSYVICLLPALVIVAVWRYAVRRPVSLRLLLGGFIVPAALIMTWQFWWTYTSTAQSGKPEKVLFAPLAAMGAFSSLLLPKLFLSIFFPLVVYRYYWERARRDLGLNLAWLTFGIACVYTYGLAEASRVTHGNFIWSGQIALFVLFVQSVVFLVRETRLLQVPVFDSGDLNLQLCKMAFALHVVFGIVYYFYVVISPNLAM